MSLREKLTEFIKNRHRKALTVATRSVGAQRAEDFVSDYYVGVLKGEIDLDSFPVSLRKLAPKYRRSGTNADIIYPIIVA